MMMLCCRRCRSTSSEQPQSRTVNRRTQKHSSRLTSTIFTLFAGIPNRNPQPDDNRSHIIAPVNVQYRRRCDVPTTRGWSHYLVNMLHNAIRLHIRLRVNVLFGSPVRIVEPPYLQRANRVWGGWFAQRLALFVLLPPATANRFISFHN